MSKFGIGVGNEFPTEEIHRDENGVVHHHHYYRRHHHPFRFLRIILIVLLIGLVFRAFHYMRWFDWGPRRPGCRKAPGHSWAPCS